MEGVQKLLVVVIITLTILLTIVGVQVILVILDVRKSLRRLNNILEDAILGGGLIKPEKLTGILELFGRKRKMETRGEEEIRKNEPSS